MLIPPLEVLEVLNLNGNDSHAAFLDEFRIVVARCGGDSIGGVSDLAVFDTRTPQNHPGSFLRLGLPLRYRHSRINIIFDCDRPLGTDSREGPFTVDPAQAVFVVVISQVEPDTNVLLAVRTKTLIGRTGSYVPWEEWGGGSVEIPLSSEAKFAAFVNGAHVVVILVGRHCRLYTFDLSKRGCRALPLRDGERRFATLGDGKGVSLGGVRSEDVDPAKMALLGDGIVVYPDPVSHLSCFSSKGATD
jgi:hypothetical protein